jgi:transposase
MKKSDYFIGIDVSSQTFSVSVGMHPWRILGGACSSYENSAQGFEEFLTWLGKQGYTPDKSIVCMEATGVYGQALAYFLVAHNYPLAVEPPLRVKRAFPTHGHKNDITDSQHVAEYAYRFFDELHMWQPPDNVLKQARTLLKTREQLTKNLSSYQRTLKILKREVVRTPMAEQMYEDLIKELKSLVKEIDKQIIGLMEEHPFFRHKINLLLSIPGVGLQLAAYILVITQGGRRELRPRELAAYLGICPYEHTSGTSVYRRPHSRKNGPGSIRKLIYLAALSLRTHQDSFHEYFMRKVAQGKPKKLVINNISNKLLRIICAVMRSGKPYIPGYVSLHPESLRIKKCA